MRRLLAVPLSFVAACTITVTPLDTHKKSKHGKTSSRHSHHIAKHSPPPTPPPNPEPVETPELKNKVHESYKPIYEKIPNSFDVPPT